MKKIKKDKRLTLKIDDPTKELIRKRAEEVNKTMSVYVIDTCLEEIRKSG